MQKNRINQSKSSRQRSLFVTLPFALGVLTSMVLGTSIFILVELFSTAPTTSQILDFVPAILTALIAAVSLFLSYFAVTEQRRSREAGTDPVILVHLGSRRDAPMMVMLCVSNVGAGAALNVSIQVEGNAIMEAVQRGAAVDGIQNIGHPIRVIPQNNSVLYNFGVGFELLKDPVVPPVAFSVTYEDIDGAVYHSKQTVDVRELTSQSAHKDPVALMSDEIGKIRREIEKLNSNTKVFNSVSESRMEFVERRNAEHQELRSRSEK